MPSIRAVRIRRLIFRLHSPSQGESRTCMRRQIGLSGGLLRYTFHSSTQFFASIQQLIHTYLISVALSELLRLPLWTPRPPCGRRGSIGLCTLIGAWLAHPSPSFSPGHPVRPGSTHASSGTPQLSFTDPAPSLNRSSEQSVIDRQDLVYRLRRSP